MGRKGDHLSGTGWERLSELYLTISLTPNGIGYHLVSVGMVKRALPVSTVLDRVRVGVLPGQYTVVILNWTVPSLFPSALVPLPAPFPQHLERSCSFFHGVHLGYSRYKRILSCRPVLPQGYWLEHVFHGFFFSSVCAYCCFHTAGSFMAQAGVIGGTKVHGGWRLKGGSFLELSVF